ncbi:MAG: hypothetical protein SH848_12650 [Saprospiraceae bacterium]|nr:hypothetical protein [Saprospiraceae bacterium]MDZ4704776.1 hypothetical protein [Saprospiraceae bacterium]
MFCSIDATKKGLTGAAHKIYSTTGAKGSMIRKTGLTNPVIDGFLQLVECFGTVEQRPVDLLCYLEVRPFSLVSEI